MGVLAGDRASDQQALKQYLLPDLKKIGVNPLVVTIPAQPSETAATNSAAPLAVERFKAAGVTTVIPLVPFNAFFPVLATRPVRTTSPGCCCPTTSPPSSRHWASSPSPSRRHWTDSKG